MSSIVPRNHKARHLLVYNLPHHHIIEAAHQRRAIIERRDSGTTEVAYEIPNSQRANKRTREEHGKTRHSHCTEARHDPRRRAFPPGPTREVYRSKAPQHWIIKVKRANEWALCAGTPAVLFQAARRGKGCVTRSAPLAARDGSSDTQKSPLYNSFRIRTKHPYTHLSIEIPGRYPFSLTSAMRGEKGLKYPETERNG